MEWKMLTGFYEERYAIYEDGTVLDTVTGQAVKATPQGPNRMLSVRLKLKDGGVSMVRVHRLVAEAFIPNPSPTVYKYVIHKDGNILNNHKDNLKWTYNYKTGKREVVVKELMKGTDPRDIAKRVGCTQAYIKETFLMHRELINSKREEYGVPPIYVDPVGGLAWSKGPYI